MSTLRILEKSTNKRGDLFGRLMADLFVALGYEQPRLNIHKSGREIDLEAKHRLEQRRAIGECKATASPIGGDDINKFVGVLDREESKRHAVTGYFISLSGFKETAIEQEKSRQRKNLILVDAEKAISELIRGRRIVPPERASEIAGRCCGAGLDLLMDGTPELLAHERGWIWAVYYGNGKQRVGFVLVHSDGTPLSDQLAIGVTTSDKEVGGSLYLQKCLNPTRVEIRSQSEIELRAVAAYRRYIAEECGYIHLDGLPADSDVGSRRLTLEKIFVPIHLDFQEKKLHRQPIGKSLTDFKRLVVLSSPGGGKSTLIKRIALAYSDPDRLSPALDDLPDLSVLPLLFRCRELRGLARASFAELLDYLVYHEPVRQYAESFRNYIDKALAESNVLLLIDGIDEIPDAGDRAAFVCTLRTVITAYPDISIVLTSREAGFRNVSAHLSQICESASLSPFDDDDISRLIVAWHSEVIGNTETVRKDAETLAGLISSNERIRLLATNPLLLTTLLLVNRWVKPLPTRRAVLYGKAIDVLLMTWNTEGHDPIRPDEALPQLCYVASAMMLMDDKNISRPALVKLIQEARNSLPEELGYVNGSVNDFINRLEDRSSILMMTGSDIENGQLVDFFEFRHLTFQEFLTARGAICGWFPNREKYEITISFLYDKFDDEKWRDVITLTAAIGNGKETDVLINKLNEHVQSLLNDGQIWSNAFNCLGRCIADEIKAHPKTIGVAIQTLVAGGLGFNLGHDAFAKDLLKGRFLTEIRNEVERKFIVADDFYWPAASLEFVLVNTRLSGSDEFCYNEELFAELLKMMRDPEWLSRCKAAIELNSHIRRIGNHYISARFIHAIGEASLSMLEAQNPREQYAAACLLKSLWLIHPCIERLARIGVIKVLKCFSNAKDDWLKYVFIDCVAHLPVFERSTDCSFSDLFLEQVSSLINDYDRPSYTSVHRIACLVLAWHTRLLPDDKIKLRLKIIMDTARPSMDAAIKKLMFLLDAESGI